MTLDEALARAAELGHDMTGQDGKLRLCQNGPCWATLDFLDDGDTVHVRDALDYECQHQGKWQREKEARR